MSCILAKHGIHNKHNISYTDVTVLDRESNYKKGNFLQMSNIFKEDDCINAKPDIESLSVI